MAMKKTWMPVTAGIVTIVSGALHLLGWIILGLGLSFYTVTNGRGNYPFWIAFLFFLLMALAIIAIIGGIFALLRRNWAFALVGAIFAIFGPLTWWLGVFATILIILSRDEFGQPVTPITTPPPQPPQS